MFIGQSAGVSRQICCWIDQLGQAGRLCWVRLVHWSINQVDQVGRCVGW